MKKFYGASPKPVSDGSLRAVRSQNASKLTASPQQGAPLLTNQGITPHHRHTEGHNAAGRRYGDLPEPNFHLKSAILATTLLFSSAQYATTTRPDENDVFSSSQTVTEEPEAKTSEPTYDAFASGDVKDNPLKIGGSYYQEFDASIQKNTSAKETPIATPLLFDGFLDSRPNDRLRGFINWRLTYDASKDQYSRSNSGKTLGSITSQNTSMPNNPQLLLDQAWIKFDIERTIFVTAGRQHVKWGSAHFWNPTDFLSPQAKDPFAGVDRRLGLNMIKMDIPWESQNSNVYGILVFDKQEPASTLGQVSAAARYERILFNGEVGIDAITRLGLAPSYGLDISLPLGPFDVYAEAAYGKSSTARYELTSLPTPGSDVNTLFKAKSDEAMKVSASAGAAYSFAWLNNRQANVGAEYFVNPNGYDDARVYPILMFVGAYKPFYLGKKYAALFLNSEGFDGAKKTAYIASFMGNLSDESLLARFDFSWRVLTDLKFEAFATGHLGGEGGEFNPTIKLPQMTSGNEPIGPIDLPPTLVDLGVALRLSF